LTEKRVIGQSLWSSIGSWVAERSCGTLGGIGYDSEKQAKVRKAELQTPSCQCRDSDSRKDLRQWFCLLGNRWKTFESICGTHARASLPLSQRSSPFERIGFPLWKMLSDKIHLYYYDCHFNVIFFMIFSKNRRILRYPQDGSRCQLFESTVSLQSVMIQFFGRRTQSISTFLHR